MLLRDFFLLWKELSRAYSCKRDFRDGTGTAQCNLNLGEFYCLKTCVISRIYDRHEKFIKLYNSGGIYERVVSIIKLFGPLSLKQTSIILGHDKRELRRVLGRLVNQKILRKIPSLVDTRIHVFKVIE